MESHRIASRRPIFANVRFWLGPLFAAGLYLALALLVPDSLERTTPAPRADALYDLRPMMFMGGAGVCRMIAPWVALTVLVAWVRTLPELWRRLALSREVSDLEGLYGLTWREFEQLVADAYRAQGYEVVETGGGGPDGGVDVVLRKDGIRLLVQCKHWKTTQVGVKPVRELFGLVAARRAHGGIVVTCGGYTREAMLFANDKRLQLLDGPAFLQMLRETRKAAPSEAPRAVRPGRPISGESEVAQEVEAIRSEGTSPSCPACRGRMVLRAARRGTRVGDRFWGCRAHPRCRGTRPLVRDEIRAGDTLETV